MAVDDIDADPVGAEGPLVGAWGGFDDGGVGAGWRAAVGAVDPLGVVKPAEVVELLLQCGQVRCRGLGGEPAFEGLVEAFDLRWVMPSSPSRYSKPLRPPVKREV